MTEQMSSSALVELWQKAADRLRDFEQDSLAQQMDSALHSLQAAEPVGYISDRVAEMLATGKGYSGTIKSKLMVEHENSGVPHTPVYYTLPTLPDQEVTECPYPCGWENLRTITVKRAAYFARASTEDGIPESVWDAGIHLGRTALDLIRAGSPLPPTEETQS